MYAQLNRKKVSRVPALFYKKSSDQVAADGDVTIAPPVDITYAPDLDPCSENDSVLDSGESWLERNVAVCYWDERSSRRSALIRERSRYIASTLNAHW